MATKYRKDMDADDFYIVKRFKRFFLEWGFYPNSADLFPRENERPPRIFVTERLLRAKIPYWDLMLDGWKLRRLKEVEAVFFLIPVTDFRHMCRWIQFPQIPGGRSGIKEGKLLDVLYRFSVLALDLHENRKWDIDGELYYVLEKSRMSKEGQFGKLPEERQRKSM